MPTSPDRVVAALDATDDPRVNGEFLRPLPGGEGGDGGVLVGVVHDHPASVHRVRTAVEYVDPDVVGLELPGIALPPFERRAREHRETGSTPDDEMSAAIAASGDARVVGIDTLGRPFVRHFFDRARREGASLGTIRRVATATAGIARSVLSRRVAARRRSPADGRAGTTFDYDVSATDPPAVQASDEQTSVARSRSLLGAVERPLADRLVDDARERTMASMLADLDGSVVAVVGIDHLDPVTDRIGPDASD